MKPIKTAYTNGVYKGDGADIIDVHAEVVDDTPVAASFDGAKEIRIYWEPNLEERTRIAAGWNIRIHMLHGVAPHWVEVVDAPEVKGL